MAADTDFSSSNSTNPKPLFSPLCDLDFGRRTYEIVPISPKANRRSFSLQENGSLAMKIEWSGRIFLKDGWSASLVSSFLLRVYKSGKIRVR